MLIEDLEKRLPDCQSGDQFRFRRRLAAQRKKMPGGDQAKALNQLAKEIQQSVRACQARDMAIPRQMCYPAELPVSENASKLVQLIRDHQVLIVAGDTGSGKTTQLPKICLEAGLGRRGLIGHTQPRRLAASSVAARIAEELGTEVGKGIGFQVRFSERTAPETYLKVMTDGILLAEIQQDRFLNRYEALIIDEAHERSLNIDFLLGYLKGLLRRRPDLKLIVTSATIDVEKFSAHFDDAPIMRISGRTFPVEIEYAPLSTDVEKLNQPETMAEAVVSAAKRIRERDSELKQHTGDVLVFLATEREIRDTAQALRRARLPDTEILPLYARLRQSEQARIFTAHKGRRIVLSTNVAETSITVPGINYVIDTGLARTSRYSIQSKIQRLPIERISKASANQRKGRCGRLAEGFCIRLYSEADFESRDEFTDPEIMRTNLASVILRMLSLKIGDITKFPFLEAPESRAVNDGFKLLEELNAIDGKKQLTQAGRQMASLPVDPKLARMLVAANAQGCLSELLIIVSALSIQDPREQGAGSKEQAEEARHEFRHPDSDFLSFKNLWDSYEEIRQSASQSQLRKYCKTYHLSYMR
ncbi:MAG: ATP-dependent RNA helicase HrpA, partial [Pseudohongiellaceae bacterium]